MGAGPEGIPHAPNAVRPFKQLHSLCTKVCAVCVCVRARVRLPNEGPDVNAGAAVEPGRVAVACLFVQCTCVRRLGYPLAVPFVGGTVIAGLLVEAVPAQNSAMRHNMTRIHARK